MGFITDDQIPAAIRYLEFLLHIFITGEFIQACIDKIGLQEPVASASGFQLVIGEDLKGQVEAAASLGLRRGTALRLIIIPQAMRVIIPPLTSQYLNLTKNSSLAVAIGYPDLVQVFAGTVLNVTGQAGEIVVITMGVYLVISLFTSLLMNWYDARLALSEQR